VHSLALLVNHALFDRVGSYGCSCSYGSCGYGISRNHRLTLGFYGIISLTLETTHPSGNRCTPANPYELKKDSCAL